MLLEAAEKEILAQGSAANVTVRAIARRAGLSHQTPGHVFGSRRGLLTALAAHEIKLMREHQEAALAAAGPASALDRLRAAGIAYVSFAHSHQAMFTLALSGDVPDPSDPDFSHERVQLWLLLLRCVSQAQAEGWRTNEAIEDVSLMCWAAVHGTAAAMASGLLGLQFPGLAVEEIAARVVQSL